MHTSFESPPASTGGRTSPGLSLAEVVVAIALLGLVLAAAFGALNQGMLFNIQAELRADANAIIQAETEHLRQLDWSTLQTLPASGPFDTAPEAGPFTTEIEVYRDDENAPDIMFVKLSVTWNERAERERVLTSIIQFTKEGLSATSTP